MKKNVFLKGVKVVMALAVITFCLLFAGGCKSVEERLSANVSEYVDNFYMGKNGSFVADFCDGKREDPFCMDGVSNTLVDYGVITVKTTKKLGENVKFKLKIGVDEYEGKFEISPFDGSYVADIEKCSNGEDFIILTIGGEEIKLENLSKNFSLSSSKALTQFAKLQKGNLKKFAGKEFLAEVFVKIVCDSQDKDVICFFVVAKGRNGETLGVLFDARTGEIYQK